MMRELQVIAAALAGGYLVGLGWWAAHAGIVYQCEHINAFYVGNQVFTCSPPAKAKAAPAAQGKP
ncbi:hypothetical protein P3G55_22350 [Leptospira sp. 96542]|nr:hypothetical protein [Leptospira sp. 96542]